MMTLITMSQGNPTAFKRTLDSLVPYCNDVVFGDLCIFKEDSEAIAKHIGDSGYRNFTIEKLPFNYIFKNGFAAILNELAKFAIHSNEIVIYMNVSEIINAPFNMELVNDPEFNCWYFIHATDPHQWVRTYNRKELEWKGIIHETVQGPRRPCKVPIFEMADTEKDMDNSFKAKVYNDIKELCYFNQYIRLVEEPDSIGVTDPGWVHYAKEGYESLTERIQKKGKRLEAFQTGNLEMYLHDIYNNPEFEKERFESSDIINFQGNRKNIL